MGNGHETFSISMSQFSTKLQQWYQKSNRQMPWRGETDIYKIWLSEVMLQQTQIKTVIPYYLKWLEKFPSTREVAQASEHDVLKYWEGLGYYSRVRNFRRANMVIHNKYLGIIPTTYEEFVSLPGVGDYIASAVLSIACNMSLPVIDANVKRVMSRVLCINQTQSQGIQSIKCFLNEHIPKKSPGNFNQALMDLGRYVCTPKSPQCNACPINPSCKSFGDNIVDKYPVLVKKQNIPHYNVGVGVIWNNDKIFVNKRKSNGHLGGLWEFPGGKVKNKESIESCIKREIDEELNLNVNIGSKIATIKHSYSHFSITLSAFNCKIEQKNVSPKLKEEWKWISPNELQMLAFPKANHKLFPYLTKENPF